MAVSLQYRIEATELYDIAPGSSSQILLEQGKSTKSQLTSSIVHDTRDNPFLTRRGHRLAAVPYIAGGFLGGTEQIYGLAVEARQYFLLWKDTILLFSGEIASVDTWGDGDRVRIFDRLFLGGSNDLRGFDFRDVGPKDIKGEPLGGQTKAAFTIEYTVPVIEKVRAAIFYDTGFVNAAPWDFNTSDVVSDVGVGVRLDLPIGPMRIDYGIPLQKQPGQGGGQFNFSVGYQF